MEGMRTGDGDDNVVTMEILLQVEAVLHSVCCHCSAD